MVELRNWAAAFGLLFVGATSCQIISGGDDFTFGGAAPVGGSGGMGGDGHAAGGGSECSLAKDCVGDEETCSARCVNGSCLLEPAEEGTPCSYHGAVVCDGEGACVACNDERQCLGTDECVAGKCVPTSCNNGKIDPGESGTDCGGPCLGCENGQPCAEAADCKSGHCDAGAGGNGGGAPLGSCAPCGNHDDCSESQGTYCYDGTCLPKKSNGNGCTLHAECSSGYCPPQDGVCCNEECGTKCRACLSSKTGQQTGTCYNVPSGQDPDGECTLNCNGNGACQVIGF